MGIEDKKVVPILYYTSSFKDKDLTLNEVKETHIEDCNLYLFIH